VALSEFSLNLAEPLAGRPGPVRLLLINTERRVYLGELGGGENTGSRDQIVHAHRGEPRAKGEGWMVKCEPQHTFHRGSVRCADRDFDAKTTDVDVRRSNNLHCSEPGPLIAR
jgi:hypothetical protein